MIDGIGEDRELSALVVPAVGAVVAGSDLWEPVRLVDGDGEVVVPVTAFLRELQAAGRSAATQRSAIPSNRGDLKLADLGPTGRSR